MGNFHIKFTVLINLSFPRKREFRSSDSHKGFIETR